MFQGKSSTLNTHIETRTVYKVAGTSSPSTHMETSTLSKMLQEKSSTLNTHMETSTVFQRDTSTQNWMDPGDEELSKLMLIGVFVAISVVLLMIATLLILWRIIKPTSKSNPAQNDMQPVNDVEVNYENIQACRMKLYSVGSGYADIIFGSRHNNTYRTTGLQENNTTHSIEDETCSSVADLGYAQSNIGGSWVDIQSNDTDFSYKEDEQEMITTRETVHVSFPVYF